MHGRRAEIRMSARDRAHMSRETRLSAADGNSMKSILGAEPRRLLSAFAQSRCLLAFDFDGTLAPIVSDPDRAKMRSSTNDLLLELSRLYPCVVISGRSVADVRQRVVGLGLKGIVGNHGIEPSQGTRGGERRIRD